MTLQLPSSYSVWLGGLKSYLEAHRGSKADLARHLEHTRDIPFDSAKVRVSQILTGEQILPADYFLSIAAWLQDRQEAAAKIIPLPPRQEIRSYRTAPKRRRYPLPPLDDTHQVADTQT